MKEPILYIDDESENLQPFFFLYSKIFTVYIAKSTDEADSILRNNLVKVVVTDYLMPKENGFDFIKRIQQFYPDIVCVILSAYSDVHLLLQAFNQGGIFKYMVKPFDSEEMRINLQQAVEVYNLKFDRKLLNVKLTESEERYRYITQSITDYIYKVTIYPDNYVKTEHSERSKEITGFMPYEFEHDEHLWFNIIYDTDRENVRQFIQGFMQTKTNESIEHRIYHKNGTVKWIRNTVILHKDSAEVITGYDGVIQDITEKKQLERQIVQSIIETEEKQRMYFAQEIHDGIGPLLSTIKLYTQWLEHTDSEADRTDIVKQLSETIDETIQIVKELSNNMSPSLLLRYGFVATTQAFIARIKDTRTLAFATEFNNPEPFDQNIEITLFRTLVECINNTIKHAHATIVTIGYTRIESRVKLQYADNGIGFDLLETQSKGKGIGLFNMQNRIESLGGTISIQSKLGAGVQIMIEF